MTSNEPSNPTRTDALRKRLARQLGRADTAGPPQAPAPFLPPTKPLARPTGPPVDLAETTGGSQHVCPHGDKAFLVETRITDLPGGWDTLCRQFAVALVDGQSALRKHLEPLGTFSPNDFLFIDLETTGLASTPVFLIGVMVYEDSALIVRQFFARDYSEERAILSMFNQLATTRRVLVSFNGKSFDLPYVRTRCAAVGLSFDLDLPHCDLLHLSRRIWKDRLPNCRLQTLETYICHRPVRTDDIDGSLIPAAYHDFVRTGDARQMVQCLHHNRLDLITLADLMTRLPPP